ncbi:hypothetical protein CBS101457_003723 [Exobasidium rhododendri]|nr:hypothetical protein CBS101457_003723 [Exobasidium rhododendri]
MDPVKHGLPGHGSYVRFYNVTGLDKVQSQPLDMFDFMPCKSKLALQRGVAEDEKLPALIDNGEDDDDIEGIYVSGQADYRKVFESKVVSRSHAVVRWMPTQQQPTLMDQGSTHGTYLTRLGNGVDFPSLSGVIKSAKEGKKLEIGVLTPLQDGDLIQLGKSISRGDTRFTPLQLFVEISTRPPLPSKVFDLDSLESELETSNGRKPEKSRRSLDTLRATLKSRLAHMAERHNVTIVSDDESDSDSSKSVQAVDDPREEVFNGKSVKEIGRALTAVEQPVDSAGEEGDDDDDDDNASEMQDESEEENDDEDMSDKDSAEEEEDGPEEILEPFDALPFRRQDGMNVLAVEEDGNAEVFATILQDADGPVVPTLSEAAEEAIKAAIDRATEAIKESSMDDCVEEDSQGDTPLTSSSAHDDAMMQDDDMMIVSAPPIAPEEISKMTTVKAEDIPAITFVSSSLAGTKRSRDETEEAQVVSEKEEAPSPGLVDTTVSSVLSPPHPPQKKVKRVGAAFGIGMATGLIAGVVGTFVGLSSFALSEI